MSTPATLDLPTSSCAASVVFTMTTVASRSPSPFTLADQAFLWPGEQWSVDFMLPPLTKKDDIADWKVFGIKLQGSYGQFYMGDPSAKLPRGVAAGSPVVDGVLSIAQGNDLYTRGWAHSVTNIMRAGDMIQVGIGLQSRLHMVMDDADSDASGKALLNVKPALRYAPNDGTVLSVNDAKGLFYMTSNAWQWSVKPGQTQIQFSASEVVSA